MVCRLLSLPSESSWPLLLLRLAERADPRCDAQQRAEADVRRMIADVRERGDAALLDFTRRFDAPEMEGPLRVPEAALDEAVAAMSRDALETIRNAAANLREIGRAHV